MVKLVSFSLGFAVWSCALNADARGRRCGNTASNCCATQNACAPSVAATTPAAPTPDAVAQGTRSISVLPKTTPTRTFHAPRSYRSQTPIDLLPESDPRRYNDRLTD
ncbi:MAG: hypothetical protein C0483_02360 [Pirellula sp.]|nr:hypothetical protein [Pirellula sp.]